MVIEVRPLGTKCNLQCIYCYQHSMRKSRVFRDKYNLEKIKSTIDKQGRSFVLFGGEPLLLPHENLDELWSWGFRRFGKNTVQTNGVLIDSRHMDMFRKYRVHVGISVDGPGELNDARWCGNLRKTRENTDKLHKNIKLLCEHGIKPGLIVTLHRINASTERIPVLLDWIRSLEETGITFVRIHILEVENEAVHAKLSLTTEEMIDAFNHLFQLETELKRMKFDIFKDIKSMLMGRSKGTACIWNACDPYRTQAVFGINSWGTLANCGRTNKDGVDFMRCNHNGFERYVGLYGTAQEDGGCSGCRFFSVCKGHCPGNAISGDWRNRTEHCRIWQYLFEKIENILVAAGKQPISLHPKKDKIEEVLLENWKCGRNLPIEEAVAAVEQPDKTSLPAWKDSLNQLRLIVREGEHYENILGQ